MPTAHLNGTTIAYEDTGSGEPVVLVHGAWVDHRNWGAVVPRLSESLRVVTYSLRGHGDSRLDAPDSGTVHDDLNDLLALSDHLGLETMTVSGISSGACIALRFASEHPARVRRVFAHEPPCFEYVEDDEELGPMLAEDFDPFEALVVTQTGTSLHERPDRASPVLAALDWDVLLWRQVDDLAEDWVAVRRADGREGFVLRANLRSPLDYRAHFARVDGRFRMTSFIAGD